MAMPYQVVGNGPYQIQTLVNKKWCNVRDMSYDNAVSAYAKMVELIEDDLQKRLPLETYQGIKKVAREFSAKGSK